MLLFWEEFSELTLWVNLGSSKYGKSKGNSAPKKVACFIILIKSINKNMDFGEKSRSVTLSDKISTGKTLKFLGWVSKILSVEKFCLMKILPDEIFCLSKFCPKYYIVWYLFWWYFLLSFYFPLLMTVYSSTDFQKLFNFFPHFLPTFYSSENPITNFIGPSVNAPAKGR